VISDQKMYLLTNQEMFQFTINFHFLKSSVIFKKSGILINQTIYVIFMLFQRSWRCK